MRRSSPGLLALAGLLALGVAGACKKSGDALLLVDVRASGVFAAQVVSIRFSNADQASVGARLVTSSLGPDGLKFGYFVSGGGGAITVLAEALDANSCVLGNGTTTFPATAVGATAPVMTLFVRPISPSTCVDAGVIPPPDGGSDASTDGAKTDGAPDASTDGAKADAAPDADTDGANSDGGGSDADAATGAGATDGGDAAEGGG